MEVVVMSSPAVCGQARNLASSSRRAQRGVAHRCRANFWQRPSVCTSVMSRSPAESVKIPWGQPWGRRPLTRPPTCQQLAAQIQDTHSLIELGDVDDALLVDVRIGRTNALFDGPPSRFLAATPDDLGACRPPGLELELRPPPTSRLPMPGPTARAAPRTPGPSPPRQRLAL